MTKQTEQGHPNGSLYCDLMGYIKWRIDAVLKTIAMVKSGQHFLDNRLAAEFCLLQLRLCCELLAVGCVTIHTDTTTKRLREMWNAEQIMSTFERLKPEFFPVPIRDDKRDEKGLIVQEAVKDALTRDEFVRMYSFFGGLLHTGTFSLYKNKETKSFDFSMLENFVKKFVRLLNTHIYFLHDKRKMIRVIMHNASDGRPWLNELDAVVPKDGGPP